MRVTPRFTIDPNDASVSVSVAAGHPDQDLNDTLIRLLEVPAEIAADRGRRVAMIFDEFQEVVNVDPHLPALMRSVFQRQPAVSHIYLGSKRHMMERIFNDENEPFWRSAKHLEIGAIPHEEFAQFVEQRFVTTGKRIEAAAARRVVAIADGHPYGTQELAYAVWEATPDGGRAGQEEVDRGLASVLRSETRTSPRSGTPRHGTSGCCCWRWRASRGGSTARTTGRGTTWAELETQNALRVLLDSELAGGTGDRLPLVEPFLKEWLERHSERGLAATCGVAGGYFRGVTCVA